MVLQKSQLRANIYGIGQLITQRKLFAVPEHQRSFSWTTEEIEQFLSDISNAIERKANDYFVGLVVMQGLKSNAWTVLDGQQRLATTTMIYAAMRSWLLQNDLEQDAKQIESEYIGVRQLGGKYSSRLKLNTENREIFDTCVVGHKDITELKAIRNDLKKKSSNWRLVDGAIFCREWVEDYCSHQPVVSARAERLFQLSTYFETSVNVIAVDVASETDAYILFESLNDRGMNLSSLDLVKNYVFSFTNPENIEFFRENWAKIARNIEGRDADDFLKVFWTSRFGLVRKLELFSKIRSGYPNANDVRTLVVELADASEKLNAIDDPEHSLWRDYGLSARDRLFQLATLGSKQVRPVILSALSRFEPAEFNNLLWILVVVIVRFQLIGQGRTGILERNLARLAVKIWKGDVLESAGIADTIEEILPDDDTFRADFSRHSEFNSSRLAYLLAMLEIGELRAKASVSTQDWRSYVQLSSPIRVTKRPQNVDPDLYAAFYYRTGNFVLMENNAAISADESYLFGQIDLLTHSQFELTRMIAQWSDWNPDTIRARSEQLSELATKVWSIGNPEEVV